MKALDHNTPFAWRPAPFGRLRKVPAFEGVRWPVYTRALIRTNKRRDWTLEDVQQLYDLLDAGYGYDAIAAKLRRSRTAIIVKTKRLNCKMTKRYSVLTARQVAALLGKGCAKSVVRWIEMEWLEAKEHSFNGRRIWRVCWDDLMAFLHEPRYWMAWEPRRITDADLRAEMTALRANQPRWLTPGEVATRYGVDIGAVNQWIHKGFLPSMRYGNHWINERDLVGWRVPADVPHDEWRRIRRTLMERAA